MEPELAAKLGEFARTFKAAARAVSLYPPTHPAIQSSLSRVLSATERLTSGGEVTLNVLPDAITIGGRAPGRPESAIRELAGLFHDHLIGEIKVLHGIETTDWLALLGLLAYTREELLESGGVSQALTVMGHTAFAVREIDYAEVLRERGAGGTADWDQIIANCLSGEAHDLDEATLVSLMDIAADVERFGEFLGRLQHTDEGGTARVGAHAAAVLRVIRSLVNALANRGETERDTMLNTMAEATSHLSPDMMLALVSHARAAERSAETDAAAEVVGRIGDGAIAKFVATQVVAEHGATERLAQAFEALVPDTNHRQRVIEAAHEGATQSAASAEPEFEDLWHNAASMLLSYSDKSYVSDDYGRELSQTRTQSIEVERVSDDPPERVRQWLETISDTALQSLDVQLLCDLLNIERDPAQWSALAAVVSGEIERLTLLGDAATARDLLEGIVRETGPEACAELTSAAKAVVERLAAGPLIRHVVLHLRTLDDRNIEPFNALCHGLGTMAIRPLAEGLASEENSRAVRRLRELLLGFGAAGRDSVEQLKNSANPAVRRTAIDLLRVFGGNEALPELASMLDDADPQVQREAIRAITQIGTERAYAVLERALARDARSRDTILQQLIAIHDEKAVPLLCYVLSHTRPRGHLADVHLAIVDSLAGLPPRAESVDALNGLLHHVAWWAPFRAARLRKAAAAALRRLGSADAIAVLEEAASHGTRSVRNVAKNQMALARSAQVRQRVRS
jgi:hypothetical protein